MPSTLLPQCLAQAEKHLDELRARRRKAISDKRETTRTTPRLVAKAAAADEAADTAHEAAAAAAKHAENVLNTFHGVRGYKDAWVRALPKGGAKDSCPDAFEKCRAGSGCCMPGCACLVKNSYYSQCESPPGSGSCNIDGARGVLEASKGNTTKWEQLSEAAQKRKEETAKAAEAAEAKQQEANTVADKAKALLVKSTDLVKSLKDEVEAAVDELSARRDTAEEAAHEAKKATEVAEHARKVDKNWEMAAGAGKDAGAAKDAGAGEEEKGVPEERNVSHA